MKQKAIVILNFIKKHAIFIVVVALLVLFTDIFCKEDGSLDAPLIGVLVAFYMGLYQIYYANKNTEDNIQIRKAEFTTDFIKEFRRLMPSLGFAAYLYGKFTTDEKTDKKIRELQKKLLQKDNYNFNIIEYNELKRQLGIDDILIEEAREEFKSDVDKIISIAQDHYNENSLSDFCSFHKLHEQYLTQKAEIAKDEDCRRSKQLYDDEIAALKEHYVKSIFVHVQNIVNDLECNTLIAQFDLLDYDKITNLIYVPLHHYMSNVYIIMMEKKIEHEKRNYYIYSNIKRFCTEIVRIKDQIDIKMNLEKAKSEKIKGEIISNAINMKKLE